MNSSDMSRCIIFNVNKGNDEFIQFNFPENEESYFDTLKRGNYEFIFMTTILKWFIQ